MTKKIFLLSTWLWILLISLNSARAFDETWGEVLPPDEYYIILAPDGRELLITGRKVYLQDQYLSSDNLLYEVITIDEEKKIAKSELIEQIELKIVPWSSLKQELNLTVSKAASSNQKGKIALYHTHNAESYVPTDGADSIYGEGGIHQVGKAFVASLKELGVTVDYSEKLHLPHDRGAYRRSRETVLELLSGKPDAIFDLHRDAAPQSAYAIQLGNEWMTQIHFVVGRQNQNLGINRKYAQSLKAIADDMYPGLIKGIFFGKGNYNQDLSPLSLLIEAGAHTNSRAAAERGISLFAEVVDHYFYGSVAEAAHSGYKQTAQRNIFGIVFFTVTLTFAIFVINSGGFNNAQKRLKTLFDKRKLK